MQRIFLGLAAIAILLLAANVIVGLTGGDYNTPVHEYIAVSEQIRGLEKSPEATAELAAAQARRSELLEHVKQLQPQMIRHEFLGIASALMALLVCSVSITYFVGTSKWFKEVVDTYRLNPDYVQENARIKRKSFRWSVAGALGIVAVVGLGAAAEPTLANFQSSQAFVLPHYLAALGAIALLLVSFYMQASALSENGELIERVMADVRRVRQERGLAVEAA